MGFVENKTIGWSILVGSYAAFMIFIYKTIKYFTKDHGNTNIFKKIYSGKKNYFLRKGILWTCDTYSGRENQVTELNIWLLYKYFNVEDAVFDRKSEEPAQSNEIRESQMRLLSV